MPSKLVTLLQQYWFFAGVALVMVLSYLLPGPVARVAGYLLGPYEIRTWLITLTMVFTAFTLPLRNIGAGARNGLGLLLLVAMAFVAYPAFTFLVTRGIWWLQGIDPARQPPAQWVYGAGLILMAAVPTTLASGIIWTRQSGGDDALALVGMILCLLCSIFLSPLVLSWTLFPLIHTDGSEAGGGIAFDPGGLRDQLIHDLTYVILIPVGLGQLLRLIRPLARLGDANRKQISIFLQLIVLVTIWFSMTRQLASGKSLPGFLDLLTICGSTLVIHLSVLVLGGVLATAVGQKRPAVIAVALNGAQKTLPIAILVLSLLPEHLKKDLDNSVWSFIFIHSTQLITDAALIPHLKAWSERGVAVAPVAVPTAAGGSESPAIKPPAPGD